MSTTTAPRPYTAPLPPPNDDPRPPSVGDVLERAADLLGEHGWVQGCSGMKGHGFCALGALIEANHDLGANFVRRQENGFNVTTTLDLGEAHNLIPRELVAWNDTPGRTKAEVVSALRGAAACARGETA